MKRNNGVNGMFRHVLLCTVMAVSAITGTAYAQTIGGDVFGGCKAADVEQSTYVEIRSGSMSYVFGGNDKSGNVLDSAYVLINGSNATIERVYGGHNAYYASKEWNAGTSSYTYTRYMNAAGTIPEVATGVLPKSRTELQAGVVKYDVFGAGFAGDVVNSRLVIDGVAMQIGGVGATPTEGRIFGAGCGDFTLIGKKVKDGDVVRAHCGNVTGTASTLVRTMANTSNCVRIMGGGYAGDAANTNLRIMSTLNQYIPAIYGGCWAGNISGTAQTTIFGNTTLDSVASEVFGGNDYAGWVANTDLTIAQGKFGTAFGGGNGNYDYKNELSLSAGEMYDTIPGSGKITFTIWDPSADSISYTRFRGNVYGGGRMAIVGDSTLRSGDAINAATIAKYGQIVMHIHGGTFERHIYAGGMGLRNLETNKRFFGRNSTALDGDNSLQLVYGLKVLNVYNCYVNIDIHGGSEYIDDGYPFECLSKDNTTLRPSSIVNILGGHFHHNVYGGGYEGTVYGSVYVNIGREAIRHAAVLNKPAYTGIDYNSVFPSHYKPQNISVEGSVYNVSDYGDAESILVFNTPGVAGGESHVFIDGSNYFTGFDGENYTNLPTMNIAASIVGSGTSTEGGDVLRQIILRHYGVNRCDVTSKQFYSIQRANMVYLDSAYVTLTGEKDLFYAYPSPSYTLCRIDTLVLHTDNFINIENPAIYLGAFRSQHKIGGPTYNNYAYYGNRSNVELYGISSFDAISTACSDSCTFFNADRNQNVFKISKGTYMNIRPYIGDGSGHNTNTSEYGMVDGYCFLISDSYYQAFVFARRKVIEGSLENENDGGFLRYCFTDDDMKPLPYVNATGDVHFRTWKIGGETGNRTREIVIIAQGDATKQCVVGTQTKSNFYYTDTVELQLPPVYSANNRGAYYRIRDVSVDPTRDKITLVNQTYMPDSAKEWVTITSEIGNVIKPGQDKDTNDIKTDPNKTFGLIFYTSDGFSSKDHLYNGNSSRKSYILSTQDYIADYDAGAYISRMSDGSSPTPTMKFVLTYSKDYKTTTAANIKVTMIELDSTGNPVAPIDLIITIYTVKTDFINDTLEAMAMYNEGYSNESVRHVVFPITFDRNRDLYLQEVKWEPYKEDESNPGDYLFNLDNLSSEPTVSNLFSVSLKPTEIVAGTPASISWIVRGDEVNVLQNYAGSTPSSSGLYDLTNGDATKGVKLGTIDGRSIAAVDCILHFNGALNYLGDTIVGALIMKFHYENKNTNNDFYVKFNVRTRTRGDTIYLASAPTVKRPTWNNVGDTTVTAYGGGTFDLLDAEMGKIPDKYVRTFEDAFKVYIPGDVIAIIDTVKIKDERVDLTVFEDKNYGNKVLSERVQIIRYSGSQERFPGKQKAYYGPMLVLSGTGYFEADYVDFNGSACTKVSKRISTLKSERVVDTLFAHAPMIQMEDSSQLRLLCVNLLNNINDGTGNLPGGALHVAVTQEGKRPTVLLSHRTRMYNNIVLTNEVVSGGTETSANSNFGAGVFNDRSTLQLGIAEDDIITITDNYILKRSENYKSSLFKVVSSTLGENTITNYQLNMESAAMKASTRNNVYLTRTPNVSDPVFKDVVTSYVRLDQQLGVGSRVGISKWFPGRDLSHKRDTILFAVSSNPYSGYCKIAYERSVFFADTLGIDTAHSTSLGPQVYLHICAFRMWQGWDSLRYVHSLASARFTREPIAVKFDSTGGVGPFSYSWYNQNTDELLQQELNTVNRESAYFLTPTNAANDVNEASGVTSHEYFCMMQATDVLGCELVQRIAVKVVEVDNESIAEYTDASNWLGKGHFYPVSVPGVDSNDFRTNNATQVAQFLRVYRVWHLKLIAKVAPTDANRGTIYDANTGLQFDPSNEYYPGDVVTLYAQSTDDSKYAFMFWDYEVTGGDTIRVVMPRHSVTVTAYFGPTHEPPTHWYRAVTYQPDGYVVDYNGRVTISDNEGLAWLISTVNGLNGQQARTFIYDTVNIVEGTYDMGAYKWTPLGNTNHPFMGVFRGVKSDGKTPLNRDDSPDAANKVIIKNLFIDEATLPYVGLFGNTDSARISYFTIQDAYIYGGNMAAGISALSTNHTDINNVNVLGSVVSGSNVIGGAVGRLNNSSLEYVTVGTSEEPVALLGDVISAGGLVGESVNLTARNNSGSVNSEYLNALYVGGASATSAGNEVTVDSVAIKSIGLMVYDGLTYKVGDNFSSLIRASVSNIGSDTLQKFKVQAKLVSSSNATNETVLAKVEYDSAISPLMFGDIHVFYPDFSNAASGGYQIQPNDTNGLKLRVVFGVPSSQNPNETNYVMDSIETDLLIAPYDTAIEFVSLNGPISKATHMSVMLTGTVTNQGKEDLTEFYIKTTWYIDNSNTPAGSQEDVITLASPVPYHSSFFFTQSLNQSQTVTGMTTAGEYHFVSEIGLKKGSPDKQTKTWDASIVSVEVANNAVLLDTGLSATWNANTKTVTFAGYVQNKGYNYLDNYQLHCVIRTKIGNEADSISVITSPDLNIYTAGVDYNEIHHFSRNISINNSQLTPNSMVVTLRKINGSDDMEAVKWITITPSNTNNNTNGNDGMVVDDGYQRFLAMNAVEPHPVSPEAYERMLRSKQLLADVTADWAGTHPTIRRTAGKGKAKVMGKTVLENNYIFLTSGVQTSRVAGLVSVAENSRFSNNYVYGDLKAGTVSSSLVVQLKNGVQIDHCYYLDSVADNVIGSERIPIKRLISSFSGQTNQCITEDYIEGVNNLTRLLNIWVKSREYSGVYNTWRSDFGSKNNGYPIFGEPDLIKVHDTLLVEGCDSYQWNGQSLFESGSYEASYVNESMFVDSTVTLLLTLYESQEEVIEDSADLENGYDAYGFHIPASMLRSLWGNDPSAEVKVFRFADSLLTVHGCDSVLVLNLSVRNHTAIGQVDLASLKVYPNPTRHKVTVEMEGMRQVELMDALGHCLQRIKTSENSLTLDIQSYPAAPYYLRITTDRGVLIKKVIKK